MQPITGKIQVLWKTANDLNRTTTGTGDGATRVQVQLLCLLPPPAHTPHWHQSGASPALGHKGYVWGAPNASHLNPLQPGRVKNTSAKRPPSPKEARADSTMLCDQSWSFALSELQLKVGQNCLLRG